MSSTITALTSGGGLAMAGDTSGQLELKTNNGTTAVTVDTSQRVLIGATSASGFDSGADDLVVGAGSGSTGMTIYSGTTSTASINFADGTSGSAIYAGGITYNHTDNRMDFSTTDGSGRMRIDSSGNLLVGTTTYSGQTSRFTVKKSGNIGTIYAEQTDSGGYNYNSRCFANSGSYYHMNFEASTTQVGSIVSNGSNTTYNTGSDYRLKDNVETMSGGLDSVKALKPVTWKWKSTGEDGQGFIAHELAEICPDAVTGQKDAIDEDGKPVYQMVDVSYLVATLTSAIQELNAKVDAQALEIATLKAK